MLPDDFEAYLKTGEWNDLEFWEAAHTVPKAAFETVCAFANTHGGALVLGVAEKDGVYQVTGVAEPDKVVREFLTGLNDDATFSHAVACVEERLVVNGKVVLLFHINPNRHAEKPVYLDGDIARTFLRKGGANCRARRDETERMLRDASTPPWDKRPFDLVPFGDALDRGSIAWYRERFNRINPGVDPDETDEEFLYHWGFVTKAAGVFVPHNATIVLFGSAPAVHHLLPRPLLDARFHGCNTTDALPGTRWLDRVVAEDNIIRTWRQLLTKYLFFMQKPFQRIDPETLGRRDDPPGLRVFREAAVNLLIHQDYGDYSRQAVINVYGDGIEFWNPGDVFDDERRLLDPGEKELRNPTLTMALRRVNMCGQAGAGLRMMLETWQGMGHPAPVWHNDRADKSFRLFLPGLDHEVDRIAGLMAPACAGGALPTQAGTPPLPGFEDATTGWLTPAAGVPATRRIPGGATGRTEPQRPETWGEEAVLRLLQALAGGAKSAEALLAALGLRSRVSFRERYLRPAREQGLIGYTVPDKPASRLQRYRLTEAGRRRLAQYGGEDAPERAARLRRLSTRQNEFSVRRHNSNARRR
ncbi:MAG: putative DNA binding domain-containing protein [Methylobacteriaceae bacterium]|jgi:ATP-dependent DNA helicase RecG|nr:putative DNA binding domain-containing protein [Methylobacteriaceae bacterium]